MWERKCVLYRTQLILQNISKEVVPQVPDELTWISKMDFVEAESNGSPIKCTVLFYVRHWQTLNIQSYAEHRPHPPSTQAKELVKHSTVSELWRHVGWFLSSSSAEPRTLLFFYPWIRTEKIVSWRQMRLTAGAEWKVSFNLGLGYYLSGLIGGKHHFFHHREDVMLIQLNKGALPVAWLWGHLHKLIPSFQILSKSRGEVKISQEFKVHLLRMCQSNGHGTKLNNSWAETSL